MTRGPRSQALRDRWTLALAPVAVLLAAVSVAVGNGVVGTPALLLALGSAVASAVLAGRAWERRLQARPQHARLPLPRRARGDHTSRWIATPATSVRPMTLTFVMVADVPPTAVQAFQHYESLVLPLLARHGGRLERRLRTEDALSEVHIVSFASQEGYASYLADEERQAHRSLLDGVEVVQRLLEVHDVQVAQASTSRH